MAVNAVAVATPLASVVAIVVFVALANVPLAPLAGAVNVTVTPGTGLLLASLTVTASRVEKAVVTFADCGVVPALALICVAVPGLFVREKLAVVAEPAAATILKAPLIALAVITAEVARPEEFVIAVLTPPANVTLAPV